MTAASIQSKKRPDSAAKASKKEEAEILDFLSVIGRVCWTETVNQLHR
ncbi:MAG: hypothetical protein AAF685_16610 [Cyanobacteria bacterium P01_C01_bin.89]